MADSARREVHVVTRIILAVIAAILLLVGAAAGVAAAWGYTSIGTDGLVNLPAGTITPGPEAQAVVIDVDTFSVTAPYVGGLGQSQLVASSPASGTVLFLGAAATPDANTYLTGVPYAVAFRDGGGWAVREVPGGLPAPDASTAPWLAQSSGTAPSIDVPTERPLSLVITGAAGAPLAPIDLAVAFSIPDISNWLLGLAIAAGVLIIVGIVLLILAFRRRRALGKHAAGQVAPVEDDNAAADDAAADDAEPIEGAAAATATVTATDETTELPVVVVEPEPPVDGVVYVIDPEEEGGAGTGAVGESAVEESAVEESVLEEPAVVEPVADEAIPDAPVAEGEQEAGDERT